MGIPLEVETERERQLVQDAINAVLRTAGYVPGMGIVFDRTSAPSNGPRSLAATSFFAKLTGNIVISTGVRWLYTFTEVAATPTFATGGVLTGVSFATFTGARTGRAANLAEWGNNTEGTGAAPWYLNDVNAHGDDYPAGFQLMPIGGGGTDQTHKIDRVVRIYQASDVSTGTPWYYFDRQNQHDGTCE